jgi:hypothetical protein
MKRLKVKIISAVAGADFGHTPGSIQYIDADQARSWEAQGTCSIFPDESLTSADRDELAREPGERQYIGPKKTD